MQKQLLLGAEAIAQGAVDAGLSGVYAYPGTPSTEITEYIQKNYPSDKRKIHSTWSSNEKTAMEAALGMSYAGKRAMVCMKHVGLNVAADAFINSAITGINGGLIITVADDPSMHSSQNEQDSRFYGKFAMIPILEPSNQQEAYEMAYYGFELSEKFELPVLLRITTRLSHSRTGIERFSILDQKEIILPKNKRQFVLLPSIAKIQYKKLLNNQLNLETSSEDSNYNQYIEGHDRSLGIIACGIGINYVNENYTDRPIPNPILKLCQYPLPKRKIERLFNECEKILVVEEGYPIVEEMVKGFLPNNKVKGRLDGTLPRDGELNPNIVGHSLGIITEEFFKTPEFVVNRPPSMCDGCGHADTYIALKEALSNVGDGHVFSDIGCYTLGALDPFNAINSCVDMGASITMAKGAADAGLQPSIAVIGDSTFTHSGITGLLDAVHEKTNITVIISDNFITGMTGQQESMALGRIENICIGIGVDPKHIFTMNPTKKNHQLLVDTIKQEMNYNGVSVIIPRRQCIQTLKNKELGERICEYGLK
jgi:indolepyruvate ferredoxin oxidoreductase alpha subunit